MRHLVSVALLSAVLVTTVTPGAVLGAAKPDDIPRRHPRHVI
jgi:hypothetical protein